MVAHDVAVAGKADIDETSHKQTLRVLHSRPALHQSAMSVIQAFASAFVLADPLLAVRLRVALRLL